MSHILAAITIADTEISAPANYNWYQGGRGFYYENCKNGIAIINQTPLKQKHTIKGSPACGVFVGKGNNRGSLLLTEVHQSKMPRQAPIRLCILHVHAYITLHGWHMKHGAKQ